MNGVFLLVFMLSLAFSLISFPNAFLSAISSSSKKAIELLFSLVSAYAVFMGINAILNQTGLSEKLSKLLEKPTKKLFGASDKTCKVISLNLIANMLGLSGVATPLGIEAMALLDSENNGHGKTLLTVISSTSIQLFPLSVIGLYTSCGGTNIGVVLLVSILSTAFSTLVGITLAKVFK